MNNLHEPVMIEEALEALQVKKSVHLKNKLFIDATVGQGGHARSIVKKGGFVLGIDADKVSLGVAKNNLFKACSALNHSIQRPPHLKKKVKCFKLVHANFKDIDKIAKSERFTKVSGILFDLGVSSPQLTAFDRGFSFQFPDTQLDMRMDPDNQTVKASDLIKVLGKSQLTDLFSVVMPKNKAIILARKIIKARKVRKIERVADLLPLIGVKKYAKKSIHPATLPFMALRLAVNSELENLSEALPKAFDLLVQGGRLVVISFHSGEDRIVKNFFKKNESEKSGKIITKKPIIPSLIEVKNNPRSRSAKLRVLENV